MPHSQDFIRALNSAAIITETDLQGRIVLVNELFCKISGYSETELVGFTHSILNSGIHSREFFSEMWTTISNGKIWFGEICNRAKDGHLYWVHSTIFPIFHKKTNEIYKYAAIRFDITERKQSELELKRKEARYREAIETSDGFCHIDNSGRFLEVSDSYCRLTGYEREELFMMNIYNLDAAEDFVERMENFNRIVKGDGKTFEIRRRRKDETLWAAEITATRSMIDKGSVFVFLHDITERKNMERRHEELRLQLNQSQKLDSIGRLTAGIAHDFNNVLASILGYNDFNRELSEAMADSEVKMELSHNVKQVDIAAKRACDLINKMLTYTRKKSDRQAIDIKPTAQIIEEVLDMLRAGLTSKIKIESDLTHSLNIPIDATDMHQIMTNLLVNARDAMKVQSNGMIKIQLKRIYGLNRQCDSSFERAIGDFIELSVSDNGSGIDKNTKEYIFDPFFTTKNVGEGTGLGLSVVNGIVRQAHGHILIDSQLGVGTTFRLLFPMSETLSPLITEITDSRSTLFTGEDNA